ncbi:MAG: hypothetical protein COB50_03455 [Thiotrichales bacterium]|nr:MAG: hypothetical protein COB50_03455 [Thiotrichales bacterium]
MQGVNYDLLTIGICIIAAVVITVFFTKKHKQKTTTQPIFTVKQLTAQQHFLLKKYAPTAQLELITEVLLISLGLLHDLLCDIKVKEEGAQTLFEQKFTEIINLFRTINKHPLYSSNTIMARSKNNAVLAFAFYRILLRGVLDTAIAQKVIAKDIDPWILLKRIPAKMTTYLGAQFWRVYELKILLFGDLNSLVLNQDIKEVLLALCNTNNVGVKNNHKPKIKHLAKKFTKWLQRAIPQHVINQDQRFYVDIATFGKEILFISDIGLSLFSGQHNISITHLKHRLKQSYIAQPQDYYLQNECNKNLQLLALPIGFSIDVIHAINGTIIKDNHKQNAANIYPKTQKQTHSLVNEITHK